MIKLKKKQDTVKALFPTILEKVKKKNQELDYENKMEVLKEKFGDLSTVSENLKNLLFIVLQNLGKKGEAFFHTDNRRKYKVIIKQPKIWQYFGKIFPGITSKEKNVQAVNQWTGELDYYDNGRPVMYPYARCKLTDDIYNVEGNNVHVDHEDGYRTNNNVGNFTFVIDWANIAKGECHSYEEVDKKLSKIVATIRKYK